ncbi:hypothetical protein [Enterovibrio calviensis]|uniref:hypothetical protein n=1 Tax=Enterovibrio calviensis TaxID=91359 RepID=UPI00048209EF|nr:hypothetical protein [Enterovibrio calviensis]
MEQLFPSYSSEKRGYLFYDDVGNVVGVDFIASLRDSEKTRREGLYLSWLEAEVPNERAWRNAELTKTDWMLAEDATYAGRTLASDTRLNDIKDYRNKLRAYNLRSDVRPVRPEWFTS